MRTNSTNPEFYLLIFFNDQIHIKTLFKAQLYGVKPYRSDRCQGGHQYVAQAWYFIAVGEAFLENLLL